LATLKRGCLEELSTKLVLEYFEENSLKISFQKIRIQRRGSQPGHELQPRLLPGLAGLQPPVHHGQLVEEEGRRPGARGRHAAGGTHGENRAHAEVQRQPRRVALAAGAAAPAAPALAPASAGQQQQRQEVEQHQRVAENGRAGQEVQEQVDVAAEDRFRRG
jgi:hypothetical protein